MENSRRKNMRLEQYDYSVPGAYFVTICTSGKARILSSVSVGAGVLDGPRILLTKYGQMVEARLLEMNKVYAQTQTKRYVIMPNHVHLLIMVSGASGTPPPTRENQLIPLYISTLKRMTNKAAGRQLWQRGYYDHIIRGSADYETKWRYIDENPAKWAEDEYY
jgi:putative transposase